MPAVTREIEESFARIVGKDRIRTDRRERKMYSFDIGAMPALVKPFIPAGVAGAVVRPVDEEQLVALVREAARLGVKLVPRAWATSGYGGVLPPEGAVVVDLSGWQRVLRVDPERMTVRVQSSAIWEEIDREIRKQGLTLRLYPSSYPSSSAAGWLAQGGSGFGSLEYGRFKDNVVAARVVLGTGEVAEFTGEDLATFIADAEGTTGIITEVEFRVRPLEEERHRLFSFPDSLSLQAALTVISEQELPIWSITAINPESVRLKKRLPRPREHPYQAARSHPSADLPEEYLMVVAYPASREAAIEPRLGIVADATGGTELDAEKAEREWEERLSPMRLKRIGPSVIPAEVLVPLSELYAVLDEIDAKIKQPFVLEAVALKGDQVVLLGFIPHDERSFNFNLAFALSLSVMEIAKKHGGAAYSTGLYFRGQADSALGPARALALRLFQQQADPDGILNPGKVLGDGGVLDLLMGTASALQGVIRPIANLATPPAEDPMREVHGIPGDVSYIAHACARCGYCVHECDQYAGRGWESQSPRGKYAYIREIVAGREKWDRKSLDTILVCTTCEVCNFQCQLQLPVETDWMELRGKLVGEEKRGTFPPFEIMAASLRGENDIWAGKREHRAAWVPDDMKPKLKDEGEMLYFAGCTASYVENDIAEATTRLLTDAGYDISYMGVDEACCGIPMKVAGKWDLFEEIYEHNTAEARRRGAKTIVTSCPSCGLVWEEYYRELAAERGEPYEFEVKHYSELIAPALADGRLKLERNPFDGDKRTVTFHDSCHLGRAQGIYEPPREMLKALPGVEFVEMEHNHEDGICCGSVVTLVGEIEVAPRLGAHRLREAVAAGADTVVAVCPCCQVQMRDSNVKSGMGLAIDDLARVVAAAAGYDIPESTAGALYMWGFFDKFIVLLEPENMAELMTEVFPQMLDAMPLRLDRMMLAMRHVPGGLGAMRQMMPALFPYLAPDVLGKVMPDLVSAVQRYIGPMPEDMEALVPDLLPETMQSLMPTYLPQLIPHLTPRFVDFVRDTDGSRRAVATGAPS